MTENNEEQTIHSLTSQLSNVISDTQLENLLNKQLGDRVTKEYMDSRIRRIEFFSIPNSTVTICSITLDNNYSVRGESACVDPANFNAQIGKKIAYDNAYKELWPLFGFLLAEKKHIAEKRNNNE